MCLSIRLKTAQLLWRRPPSNVVKSQTRTSNTSTAVKSLGRTETLAGGILYRALGLEWSFPEDIMPQSCILIGALELQSCGPVLTRNATTVGAVGYMAVLLSSTLGLASYFCLVARSHQVNRWVFRLTVVRSGRVPGHTRPDSALYPRFRPEQSLLFFCPPQS